MGKHTLVATPDPEPWRPPGTPYPPTTGTTFATGGVVIGPSAIPTRSGYGYPGERFMDAGVISSNPRWQKVMEELNRPRDLDKAREESANVRDTVLGEEVKNLRDALDEKIGRLSVMERARDRWQSMFNTAIQQRDTYRAALERANDAIEYLISGLETARHERDSNDDLLGFIQEDK